MFKVLIGLSFISVIAEMLLSDDNFKKYIKSLMGILVLLIIIQSVLGLKDIKLDYSPVDEIKYYAKAGNDAFDKNLRNEVLLNVEKKIIAALKSEGIEVIDIKIDFTDNFIIKKISLKLKEYSKFKDRTINILVDKFMIDKEAIVIS